MCFGESPERRNSGVIVRFLPPSLPRQPLPVRGKINLHCLSLSPARSAQRKFFFASLGAKGSSSLCQESSPLYIDWRQSIHKHPSPTEAGQLGLCDRVPGRKGRSENSLERLGHPFPKMAEPLEKPEGIMCFGESPCTLLKISSVSKAGKRSSLVEMHCKCRSEVDATASHISACLPQDFFVPKPMIVAPLAQSVAVYICRHSSVGRKLTGTSRTKGK